MLMVLDFWIPLPFPLIARVMRKVENWLIWQKERKIPCNSFNMELLYSLCFFLLGKVLKSFSLNTENNGCKNSTSLHVHYRANGKYDEMVD